MKTLIKNIWLFIISLLIMGCEKEQLSEKATNTTHYDNVLINVSFQNENTTYHRGEASTFERGFSQTDSIEYIIQKNFNYIPFQKRSLVQWIVMYSEKLFSPEEHFLLNEYNGLSVFYVKDGKILHDFYRKNLNGIFKFDSTFRYNANKNIMPKTLKTLAKKYNTRNIAYFVIANTKLNIDNLINYSPPSTYLDYSFASQDNIFTQMLDTNKTIDNNYGNCNPMNCAGPAEVGCQIDAPGGLSCRGSITDIGDCVIIAARTKIQEENLNLDLTEIDLSKGRDFRDNFLSLSSKGQLYIEYYHKFSYVFSGLDFIDRVSIFNNYEIAVLLYDIADRLENGNNNDIIINNSEKIILQKELDNLSVLSTNQEFQSIIIYMKNDLDRYVNKTRGEILVDFQ